MFQKLNKKIVNKQKNKFLINLLRDDYIFKLLKRIKNE
jgi:hypothetical protein